MNMKRKNIDFVNCTGLAERFIIYCGCYKDIEWPVFESVCRSFRGPI